MSIRERFKYAAGHVNFRQNVLKVAYPDEPVFPDKLRDIPSYMWADAKCSLRSYFGPVTGLVLGTREVVRFGVKFFEGPKSTP